MTASAGTIGTAAPQGLPLAQLGRLLWRHAFLILACAVIGAVAAYAYARTQPKHYTASSLIAVEGDRFAIPELQGALRSNVSADPLPFVRTEMQAITARDLVRSVATRLKLVEVPEFNSDLRPPSLTQTIKSAVQSWLPQSQEVRQDGPEEGVLTEVFHALSVFQDNRSLAIQVSFTAEDPKLASDFVNALVSEYIQIRTRQRDAANQGANKALTERIEQVRSDVAAIEKQMRDLRNSNELVMLRAGSVGQQQLEELATAASRTSVERAQLETTYQRATTLARQGSSDALANVLGSATISQLRTQEATASQRVAELSSRYGTTYPAVRSAQAELDSVRRQVGGEVQRIVASLDTQLRVAREHETDVKRQLEQARRLAVGGENARAQLDQLQQEATTRRTLYQTLLERAQQTVSQPGVSAAPDVRVLGTAAPPGSPSGPNMKIASGLGGVAGLLLGCVFALVRTRAAGGTVSEGDLAASGINVVATLPRPLGRAVTADGPDARALRALRAEIRHLGRSRTPRTVVLAPVGASGGGASGARHLACALAQVAAADGETVLLIDGGLAGTGGGALGVPSGDLFAVLDDGEDWREVAATDPNGTLHVLAAAQPAGGARNVINGVAFQNLLVEAASELDLVVLAAPAAASEEAVLLARRSDLVLLVLDPRTPRDAALAAAEGLGGASRCPVAAVMIGA